jgi:hypothetical protein
VHHRRGLGRELLEVRGVGSDRVVSLAHRLEVGLSQGLFATGGDGSSMAVEDAVSAQFGTDISAFAKPAFERLRRTRHAAQYFDPTAAPITKSDASWAIEKATAALSGAKALLAASPPERFG